MFRKVEQVVLVDRNVYTLKVVLNQICMIYFKEIRIERYKCL